MTKAKTKPASDETPDDLPEGWAATSLEELLVPGGLFDGPFGSNLKTSDYVASGVRVIRLENIGNLKFNEEKRTYITRRKYESLRKHRVQEGDIIFGSFIDGDTRVCVLPALDSDAIAKADCFCVRPRLDLADRLFVASFLATSAVRDTLTGQIHGATRPRINTGQLRQTQILLPPLAEQKRVVDRIAELSKSVNASRDRLTKVPKILKAFRKSVLAAACSGRLTEDWREKHSGIEPADLLVSRIKTSHENHGAGHGGQAADPTEGVHNLEPEEFPATWCVEELKWLCKPGRPITYGILKPGPDYPNGVQYVRVADFPGNRLSLDGIRRTSPEIAHEYRRSTLNTGDVLLSIRGTAGRVCRIPKALDGANITQDTARISVHNGIDPDFIALYLQSPSAQHRFDAAMKGVAVRGVNIGDVRALQIAVPPRDEQQEIVRRVDILFKLSDKIEKRVEAATKRADKLTQAILAKAFRGELVPTEAELARQEGRDYEPASALLGRIKSEREKAAASTNGAGRKRRAAKSGKD